MECPRSSVHRRDATIHLCILPRHAARRGSGRGGRGVTHVALLTGLGVIADRAACGCWQGAVVGEEGGSPTRLAHRTQQKGVHNSPIVGGLPAMSPGGGGKAAGTNPAQSPGWARTRAGMCYETFLVCLFSTRKSDVHVVPGNSLACPLSTRKSSVVSRRIRQTGHARAQV